jgi:hypothetical protein
VIQIYEQDSKFVKQ